MGPVIISFWAASKIVCTTPSPTLFKSCEQKLKLLLRRSQATCSMTVNDFVVSLQESTWLKDFTWHMCSHEDHVHTNSP
jgi:hypothetical protein